MGLNKEKLILPGKGRLDYKKSYRQGGGFKNDFPFLRPKDLPEGQYRLRFLPEYPGKCADGFRHVWFHRLYEKMETTNKDCTKFFCMSVTNEDCCACQLLEALQEHMPSLNETAQKALSEMSTQECMLIPCIIDARHERPPTDTDKYPPFVRDPEGKRFGAIFQLENLKRLTGEVQELMNADTFVADLHQGRELLFIRTGKLYDLKINPAFADRCALPEAEKVFMSEDCYPNIDSFYSKSTLRLTYAEMWDRIRNCFWWQYVRHLGIDMADEVVHDDITPYQAADSQLSLADIPF